MKTKSKAKKPTRKTAAKPRAPRKVKKAAKKTATPRKAKKATNGRAATKRAAKPRQAAKKRAPKTYPKRRNGSKAGKARKPTAARAARSTRKAAAAQPFGGRANGTKRAGSTGTRGRQVLRRRKNSGETAADLFEQFHGTPSTGSKEHRREIEYRDKLAELGKLRRLDIYTSTGAAHELDFSGPVILCAEPTGRQLYILGGNQALDLDALDLGDGDAEKDHVYLGECAFVVYDTRKGFHNFERTEYGHEFGEEGGELPTLNYDRLNRLLYFTGGSYLVKPEGIVN